MRRRGRGAGVSLASAHLLAALLAAAQVPEPPPADDVTWQAPAECPGRDALLAGIAARRGRALEPGQARVVARTTLLASRRYRLVLHIDVGGRRDARVLTAKTCAALVDAAALVIVLAVDEGRQPSAPPVVDEIEAELGAPTPDPGPPPPIPGAPPPDPGAPPPTPDAPPLDPGAPPLAPSTADPPAAPDPTSELGLTLDIAPPPSAAPRPRRPGGFLRLVGLAEVGALPGPTGGVGLAGGLLWRWFRLELQASYLAPRARELAQADVRVSLFSAAVLGCARLGWRPVEIPLCLGFEGGGLPGVLDGPAGRTSAVGRWLAVTYAAGAAVRIHPRVAVWASLQASTAFHRGTFVLGGLDGDLLYDPGVASGRLALGVELRFGAPRRPR